MDQTGGTPNSPSEFVWVEFYAGPCDGDRTRISKEQYEANMLYGADCVVRRPITTLERKALEDAGSLFAEIEYINHVYLSHPRRPYTMLYSHSFAFQP